MNDLMNHNLRKLKLLMPTTLIDILRNHRHTILIIRKALTAAIQRLALLIVVIERAHTVVLADAAIAHGARAVVLPAQVEGLQEQQDGHADDGDEQQQDLDDGLARVQLLLDGAGREEHVDEHVEEARRRLRVRRRVPVDGPFVDDGEDEVAEDALEEEHARDEVAPDVDGRFEVAGVDEGEAERVGHLVHISISFEG